MPSITVFTPTFNRAHFLPRVYRSLLMQNYSDFEWLIIDDGSTDETESVINSWQTEKRIDIQYYKQPNGGKQRTWNKALTLARSPLFFCLDSDDLLASESALSTVSQTWQAQQDKVNVAGMIGVAGKDATTPYYRWLPDSIQYTTVHDLYAKFKFKGDAVMIYRTDILQKFPFILCNNEKFMSENFVFQQIDKDYIMALVNSIFIIHEYYPDGYTNNINQIIKTNPFSYRLWKKQSLDYVTTPREKLVVLTEYIVGCMLSQEKIELTASWQKRYFPMAYIGAVGTYIFWYHGRKK